ncbi:hypothetical protein Acr_23g0003340 [Actinidia rufa]|uniref:Uncharacterized protein n=1 Tax=Actinidia rufa TaxID=165716 RepID=A0A7J0GMB2_9ERIC|nr:hypothetical protein Acr_23g0003340 [Actinidia rufa]
MATSAFKSTTKRDAIGIPSNADDSGSSNRVHRRSRTLSQFSRRVPEPEDSYSGETPVPAKSGSFVSTVRGSEFPEISLDDLVAEFFSLKESVDDRERDRGRSSRRCSETSRATAATVSSQRRGRSVSRQSSQVVDGRSKNSYNSSDANSRRRRSVSAARCQISDSESDIDHSRNSSYHGNIKRGSSGNSMIPSLQKPIASSHRQLGRSLSQIDLSKTPDGYSSQSSALTDDEAKEIHSSKNVAEKTIRAVYAQKKVEHPTGDDVNNVLYEAMRKELRHAVDEIKMELEHATMVRTTPALDSESCLQADNSKDQAVSKIRKNYATKLEKSEKRKQDLLVEIVMEEQRGRELSKIVRELHPDPKSSTIAGKPSRSRKRSNDRNKLSNRLTEEAEKYFEDFISNVEDTDLSSFDGERSGASSTLGVRKTRDPILHSGETETFQITTGSNSLPVETDGVILPWLKWDASNDDSLLPSNHNRVLPVTLKSLMWDAAQANYIHHLCDWDHALVHIMHALSISSAYACAIREVPVVVTNIREDEILAQGPSGHSTSSRGSWSTELEGHSLSTEEAAGSILKELASPPRSQFDMDRYLELKREEDLMFERWKEQHRISSGGLLLCSNAFI